MYNDSIGGFMDTIEHILFVINKVRPFLINDGGDVEFVKYEEGIVYLKLVGACKDCSLADEEIKDTVETILTSEIPEVIEVKVIDA